MARIWQVRYRESITEVRSTLAEAPHDREGRSLVLCGRAGAVWSAEARAERLAESYAVTEPRPAAGLSGLREALDAAARSPRSGPPDPPPHQGWRT
jgi:hypothetical protein